MKKPAFLVQFENLPLAAGQFAALHLGQHSFVLRIADRTIWLDPFLTPTAGRLIPPPLTTDCATVANIITGSHDHSDHIDRPSLQGLAKASRATFVFPAAIRHTITEIPQSRICGLNDGCSVTLDGVKITAVAAAHERLDRDPATGLYPYLGFVLEYAGVTVYHAGDCCLYEGIHARLRQWKHIDLAFLPINGRDAYRYTHNCIGNMTYQEAADLAGDLNVGIAVPAHFDMFAANTENPALFVDYMHAKYPSVKVWKPAPGTFMQWTL